MMSHMLHTIEPSLELSTSLPLCSYIANNYINNMYIMFPNDSSVLFLSILYNAHPIARGQSHASLGRVFLRVFHSYNLTVVKFILLDPNL